MGARRIAGKLPDGVTDRRSETDTNNGAAVHGVNDTQFSFSFMLAFAFKGPVRFDVGSIILNFFRLSDDDGIELFHF